MVPAACATAQHLCPHCQLVPGHPDRGDTSQRRMSHAAQRSQRKKELKSALYSTFGSLSSIEAPDGQDKPLQPMHFITDSIAGHGTIQCK